MAIVQRKKSSEKYPTVKNCCITFLVKGWLGRDLGFQPLPKRNHKLSKMANILKHGNFVLKWSEIKQRSLQNPERSPRTRKRLTKTSNKSCNIHAF